MFEDDDEDPLLSLRGEVLSATIDEAGSLVLFYPHGRTLTVTLLPDTQEILVFPGSLPEC